MTIRLRAHHLLCMITFAGKGYSPAFVTNFERVARRITAGEEAIQIVDGPDDICAVLLADTNCHCHDSSIIQRDRRAAEAISELAGLPIRAGTQLLATEMLLPVLREAFVAGTIRGACVRCQWKPTCDAIAEDGFTETRLLTLRCQSLPAGEELVSHPSR